MNTVLELRQKRADLWGKAKKFLEDARNGGGILTAEDAAQYEKMESDIVALGKEIDIMERQAEMDKMLNVPTVAPVLNNPNGKVVPAKTGTASDEYKNAFWFSLRNKYSYSVHDALQIGTDSEGGALVPDEFEAKLIDGLREANIIRNLATVINTSNGDTKIPVVASHGKAAWTNEEEEYAESDDAFTSVTLGAHKLTTIMKVSEELLNDSAFNLEMYIAQEFVTRMAAGEESGFIAGDGNDKPTGLIQTAQTGITSASATAITSDEIIDLYHSLRLPYRMKAAFIANDSTIKAIRKLKDANGQYLWQPGLQMGQPDMILNRPIYTSIYMPEIGAGNKILLFGDMSYYWIADREGRTFQRLNELFAKTGQVGFKASQRVDGKLILPEAVKTLQMGE